MTDQMTTNPLRAGDTLHALADISIPIDASGLPGSVRFIDRGTTFVLTDAMLDGSRDRHGSSWLVDLIDEADEQVRRWGVAKIGRGQFPADERISVHGSAEWSEERKRARDAADALVDPEERALAFKRTRERFDLDRPWAAQNGTWYGNKHERKDQIIRMSDMHNRARGVAFREAVALVLKIAGHQDAVPRRRGERRKLSEAILDESLEPDVDGLRDVWLDVRADVAPRWSSSLDAAEQSARLSGRRFAAVTQWRQGHGVADAFVVMTVATFGDLIKEATHARG